MTTFVTCPDAASLERFLLGRLQAGERDQLEEHLLTCAACSSAVQVVKAEDTLVEAVRLLAGCEAMPETPVVCDLIERVRRLRTTAEPMSVTKDEPLTQPPALVGPEFPFLAPPGGPGEIGRLGPYRVL